MDPIRFSLRDASGGPLVGPIVPANLDIAMYRMMIAAWVTGVVDYTIEGTSDDIYAPGYNPAAGNWSSLGLNNLAADNWGTILTPWTAYRVTLNAGAGSIDVVFVQPGLVY